MSAAITLPSRRAFGAAVILASLTALGGCGGGGSDPAPAPQPPAPPSSPTIGVQPSDQSAVPGGSVTFTVSAAGSTLAYQWTRNGVPIDGATNASYTTPALTAQDNAAVYRVNMKNSLGSVWTDKAMLTVSGEGLLPFLGAPGLPAASVAAPGSAFNPNDSVALRGQEALDAGSGGIAVDAAGTLFTGRLDQISKVERGAPLAYADTRALGGLGAHPEITGLAAGGRGSLYALAYYNRSTATPRPLRVDSARQVTQIEVADRPDAAGPVQWSGVAADSADYGYFLGFQPVRVCDGGSCASQPRVLLLRAPAGAAGAALLFAPDDGIYAEAPALRFTQPGGVAVGPDGSVYVADRGNHVILRISQSGQASVVAGAPGVGGSADGDRATARLNAPTNLALDAAGNLYVVDSGSYTIRKLTPAGVVGTVAGQAGSNGLAYGRLPGRLPAISHLAAAPDGTLYASVVGGVIKVVQAAR